MNNGAPAVPAFDAPWRIHLRLTGSSDTAALLPVIREASPLVLILEVDTPADVAAVDLPWPMTSVTVILRDATALGGTWPEEPSVGAVGRWEIPVEGPGDAAGIMAAVASMPGAPPADRLFLRWWPKRGQMDFLPTLLTLAGKSGWGLTLPNRPADVITAEGAQVFPDPAEVTGDLSDRIRAAAGPLESARLRIHDFIIARILGMEGPEPQGCEAANSLAFVDADGTVYACSTLQVRLGILPAESLAEIWSKPVRSRLRKALGKLPELCGPCPHLAECVGGCRGAVYHLEGDFAGPDPLCDRLRAKGG